MKNYNITMHFLIKAMAAEIITKAKDEGRALNKDYIHQKAQKTILKKIVKLQGNIHHPSEDNSDVTITTMQLKIRNHISQQRIQELTSEIDELSTYFEQTFKLKQKHAHLNLQELEKNLPLT